MLGFSFVYTHICTLSSWYSHFVNEATPIFIFRVNFHSIKFNVPNILSTEWPSCLHTTVASEEVQDVS